MEIVVVDATTGTTKDMLMEYANITLKQAKEYLNNELDPTTQPCWVQNDTALYHCLYNSLNMDASRNQINLKKKDLPQKQHPFQNPCSQKENQATEILSVSH
jgi:hypothetical protein